MNITDASHLTNAELVVAVGELAHGERAATVALIVHLGEFEARRLFEAEGFSSTFSYCLTVLRLSEDATFNRIEAARLARRYPSVLEKLVSGELSPTTARMLARRLTEENHEDLPAAASGKSKSEVESLLAGLFPRPDVRASIRPLGALVEPSSDQALQRSEPSISTGAVAPSEGPTIPAPADPAPTSEVRSAAPSAANAASTDPLPLAITPEEQRYAIGFTARAGTHDKLRRAQDLLGHAVPRGDVAEVIDRALTLLVESLERTKLAATAQPRPSRAGAQRSRHVPAEVRRTVWSRDGGRCAFVAANGRRCDSRRALEFHHVRPYGVGGAATVANIQLRCRPHSGHEVELFYGKDRRYGSEVAREPQSAYGGPTRSHPFRNV
jgi:hypothetical protein